jgi:NAD(P)-dependent dehydrogenase (short-subunit alcohol dehydrogenase family)
MIMAIDPSTSLSLAGLNALVIGGTSGIGEAAAHGFVKAGARVAIAGRTPAKLDAALTRLSERSPSSAGYVADVTRQDELQNLSHRACADLGRIDVLMNCQGITIIKPTVDFTEDEFNRIVATNLTSVFFACTVFGRTMIQQGGGAIINIASLAAHRGWPRSCPYAATKHGVVGLTTSMAAEWAAQGVRVNAISPGFFITELNRDKMSPDRKESALRRTPIGRFGDVHELVGAAVYLASPAASFVTGAVLNVDGGYLASGI